MEQKNNICFAVMKLQTDVEVADINGKYHSVKVEGIKGFIPVFDDILKAEIASCDGKYKIMEMKIPEQTDEKDNENQF